MTNRNWLAVMAAALFIGAGSVSPASAEGWDEGSQKLFQEGLTECCSFTMEAKGKTGVGCVQLTKEEAFNNCQSKSCDQDYLTKKMGTEGAKSTGGCFNRHLRVCVVSRFPFGRCASTKDSDELEEDVQQMFPN